jgi:hypothetical protein
MTMDPKEEVELVLADCFLTVGRHLNDKQVSREAIRFWRNHYRPLFLSVLSQHSPRMWSHDRRNVMAKARDLAVRAAELATLDDSPAVLARHAEQASDATDCRPDSRAAGMGVYWCSPRPTGYARVKSALGSSFTRLARCLSRRDPAPA